MRTIIEILFLVAYAMIYIIRPIWLVLLNKRRGTQFDAGEIVKREPLSIIIPAHNEAETLAQTVIGLMNQHLGEYEIIIGENNSTDNTIEIARDLERQFPDRITVLRLSPPRTVMPISWTLNRMLDIAKYDLIVRIDADSLLEDELAISKLVAPIISDPTVSATGGNVRIRNQKSTLLHMQGIEFLLANEINKRHMKQTSICLSGCYMAFRKSRLPQGFIEERGVSEDMTATIQLSDRTNGKTLFVHDSVIYTDGMSTLPALKKQRNWWTTIGWRAYFHNRHAILNHRFGLVGVNLAITIAMSCRSFLGLIFRGVESLKETPMETLVFLTGISLVHVAVTILNVLAACKLAYTNERVGLWHIVLFALWYGPMVGWWRFVATFSVLIESLRRPVTRLQDAKKAA